MNKSHCKDELICPGGNCPGCKDGFKWCHDPRCDPQCTDCMPRVNHDHHTDIIFFIIVIGVLAILFVFVVLYGPNFIYNYIPVSHNSEAGTSYDMGEFL